MRRRLGLQGRKGASSSRTGHSPAGRGPYDGHVGGLERCYSIPLTKRPSQQEPTRSHLVIKTTLHIKLLLREHPQRETVFARKIYDSNKSTISVMFFAAQRSDADHGLFRVWLINGLPSGAMAVQLSVAAKPCWSILSDTLHRTAAIFMRSGHFVLRNARRSEMKLLPVDMRD